MKTTCEVDILCQFYKNLSEEQKQEFLNKISIPGINIHTIIQPKEIKACPHCESSHFVKNGKRNGRQNYLCRTCHKAFVENTGTILYGIKKDISVLKKFIECMIEKLPLRKCAEICKISKDTAWLWRHKILCALNPKMAEVELNGIIEADETFTHISYKGNHKQFKIPRPSHKRGTKATKRGLSKEQVCIATGVNLNELAVAKVSNLGFATVDSLRKVFDGKIAEKSILVTDSHPAYEKLSIEWKVSHIKIPHGKFTSGVFNIQMVNNYHSRLKGLIFRKFRGVATKYMNNYITYHNFVNFEKDTEENKKVALFYFVRHAFCDCRAIDIKNMPPLPI